MKQTYIKIIGALLVLVTVLACEKTDGALYQGEADKISFLGATVSLNMEGGSLTVPVGRTSTDGVLSVPLTISAEGSGYTDVFKMDGPVTFADGVAKSYAKVVYGDFSTIDPSTLSIAADGMDVNVGLAFPITLNIAEEDASPSNLSSMDVLASNQLEFEGLGTTKLNSVSGWAEEELTVNIQKAKGANVYKVVSPFGFRSFAFMIKADGKTIVCPNQIVANTSAYGAVTMSNVTGTFANGKVTLNVGAYTVSAGSFGAGVEVIDLP